MTIGELSQCSGVTVRTLRHYDKIGLLRPTEHTVSGYRLYDEASLRRLHTILLFRELEVPLDAIRRMLSQPDFDPGAALEAQICQLKMRRAHVDALIARAYELQERGIDTMDFKAFDKRKQDDYTAQAKAAWGKTEAWKEYESRGKTAAANKQDGDALMALFAEFGKRRDIDPTCDEAQAMVKQLQDFITANFYTCTVPILRGLADMYDCGGDFTTNIDKAGGQGTASFIANAIREYCKRNM